MLQGCYRFGGLQGCNQIKKFSINMFSDLVVGFFFYLLLPLAVLFVCHNSVKDPVGFNCANSVIWQKCTEIR